MGVLAKPVRSLAVAAFVAILLSPLSAHAGDVKFGSKPLATDGDGKLTGEGKKAAVETLPSVPGEELWTLHLWTKIDNGAPGPLYVEFKGKTPDGKPYTAFRHEKADYDGQAYVSMEIELDGNSGFNKGKTYDVRVVQVSTKGKDLVLAQSKLTLQYTEPEEDEGGGDDGGDTDEGVDTAEQDAIDTLVGGEGGGGDAERGPPPVAPKKKGCSVAPEGGAAFSGLLVLFALGGAVGRRRRA